MIEPIRDVIAMDKALAQIQDEAMAVSFNGLPLQVTEAVKHGLATDLRSRIAGWVAETREDDERDAAIERLEEAHRV